MVGNRGLSNDIEEAILDTIEGLDFDIKVKDIDDAKMRNAVRSKLSAFKSAKRLLEKWVNSSSSPSKNKIHEYTTNLVDAGERAKSQMRDALKKKIDYAELDADKIAAAVEAKPFILENIHELHSEIVELRLQLEGDEINFSEKEFKIGYPEKMARGELINTSNYHKFWYNEKEDAVKLCPYGGEGEIIELYGLKIQLPEVPEDKSRILFSNLPKFEQYWRRTPMPKGLTKDNEEEYVDYIIEEFKRRVDGVWFMNKGVPVYLTGHMYFWLQWYKDVDDGGYSDFRYAQLHLSYHTKACEIDKRCIGQLFPKSRRTGFTLEKLAMKLNKETMMANFRSGLTSKSDTDAEAAFKKKQYAFKELPFFFKPVVKGNPDSDKSIFFGKPSNASKAAKKNIERDNDLYLNTETDYRATTNGAYDSIKLNDYLSDECFKWKKPASYDIHWKQVSPTMDENGIIVGKAWLGSTVGAYEEGGKIARPFWNASDPRKRNKVTKRTGTGLYRYFMSVDENSAAHTDKYGICHQTIGRGARPICVGSNEPIEVGSKDYWDAKEKEAKKEGQEMFNEQKRNHPRNIEDAFRFKVEDSAFNIERIQDQIAYNDIVVEHKIVVGDFVWKNGDMECGEVEFKIRDNGRFAVTWMPPTELRNQFDWIKDQRHPKNDWLGAGGLDPFGKDQTADKRQSKGAFHFINRVNAHFPETGRMFVLEYIHRPPTRNQFFEDALMASLFYGYPILAENDKDGIITYFEQRGYLGYLMKRPKRYMARNSRVKDEIGVPGTAMVEPVYYALNDYINQYVGETKEGEVGKLMLFNRTLQDWLRYEPSKRTAYDATVSSGMALCAIQTDIEIKKKTEKTVLPVVPVRKYKVVGNYSKSL